MNLPNLGNALFQLVKTARHALFDQGELAQLLTITEALLGDLVRAVVVRHPQKLSGKRTIQLQAVIEAQSLEEVHMRATDALLNDLSH